jgi:streptogramin lyase
VRARIAIASTLVLMLLGAAGAVPAAAHHPSVTEYQTGLSANGGPWDLVDGGDGRMWFTEDGLGAFGPLSPGDGLIGEITGKLLYGNPKGITRGPDGLLWIAESATTGAVARLDSDGGVTEFDTGLVGQPYDVAAGPDRNIWFTAHTPSSIGRIAPDGTITQFSAGLNGQPDAIAAGPDGNVWFTEPSDPGRIGRIAPDGAITENSIGLPANMAPTDITAGPDGNMWFTLAGDPGGIGRITAEGVFKVFLPGSGSGSGEDGADLTPNSRPTGIAAGTDGALWFTESASPGRIGRITTGGDVTEYTEGLTSDRAPWMIAPGPDGNMWFTENANPGALARISLPPLLLGTALEKVGTDSAVIDAKVSPNAQETEVSVVYGTGSSLKQTSSGVTAGAGWDPAGVRVRLDGLLPGKKIRYRVVATNDSGSDYSDTAELTTEALEPEHGEVVVAQPAGRVRVKRPGGRWRRLAGGGAELPVGTSIDTRHGRIRLTSAARNGRKQTGSFHGGVMQVRQPRRARGRVDIYLRGGDFSRCARPARRARRSGVSANASYVRRETVRRLWGRDRGGRFRTFGRHSQATVRGTRWLTKDTCAGTLTVVTRGAVVVRDFARRRNVLVRAGHRYLAHRAAHPARTRR